MNSSYFDCISQIKAYMETSILIALIFLATITAGCLIKMLFNSECTDVDCFCVRIKRNVKKSQVSQSKQQEIKEVEELPI